MTPLFPLGFLDQGWYLVIIFFIGLFFGLVLEQSGFSSSRKLAGVFYGYDFVVLKVFFTAGITAMTGLVILGYFGIVEMGSIVVNSNFLVSAVVGGAIMGFGFILGGFCPGTSITGAVIGKIDAMVFIAGIFLGIFVFGAFDTTFNKLFTGHYFDHELLSDTLGIGKHLLVFLFVLMALAAFGVASYFEKRSTRGLKPTNKIYTRLGAEVAIAILIGFIILFLPQERSSGFAEPGEKKVLESVTDEAVLMNADEVAYLILHNPKRVNLVDVRTEAEFNTFHLPAATHIPLANLTDRTYKELFNDPLKKHVLVSNGGVDASKALVILTRKGYKRLYVLEGGMNSFVETIFKDNTPPEGLKAFDEISKYRFRQRAAALFSGEEGELNLPQVKNKANIPVVTAKPTGGGC